MTEPTDIQKIRSEFPVTGRWSYMNHAAVGPLTARAAAAMGELIADAATNGAVNWRGWLRMDERARAAIAAMVNAEPQEIAFIKNTSEGVNLVARGLDLRPGDVVLTVEGEFVANVTPWLALRDRGVRVRFVPDQGGRVLLDDIASALTPDVRVLAISHVEYLSGFKNDLETIGKLCRERGKFLFVDAIQGFGALRLDVERFHIDAFAADGHKWLCAPEGAGVLYVSRAAQEQVKVTQFGWLQYARRGRFADYYAPLRNDARRYEPGTLNHVGIAGLAASVELLSEHGAAFIEGRVLALADRVAAGALARGYRILGSRAPGETSGIVSIAKDGIDALMADQQLLARGIVVGQREGFIRVACHFYNTDEEVDALMDALP